jgi:AcrR family transcriptional regulator
VPSITRRPRKTVDRRPAIEQSVLVAVDQLLREGSSFTELSVQRIAEAAGIARSTFYIYFDDKTALMLKMAEDLGRGAFEVAGEVLPELDDIVRAHRDILGYYRERAHVLVAVTEVAGYEPTVRDVWNAATDRFAENLAGLLRAEQEAGRAPVDLDPTISAEIIVWGGIRVIIRQVTTRDADTDAEVARQMAVHQWYGAFRAHTG